MKNSIISVWVLLASILIIPLFVMSLNRGALPVDDLTYLFGIAADGDVLDSNKLLKNFAWNICNNPGFFRPIAHLIFNVQYVLFGGNFWLFYAIKWISKIIIIYIAIRISERLDISWQSKLFIVSFILFNPTAFETRIFSSDSWLELFYITFLWLVYFKLSEKSSWISISFAMVLWLCFLGSKESAILVGGVYLFAVTIINLTQNRVRYLLEPIYILFIVTYLPFFIRLVEQVHSKGRSIDHDFNLFRDNIINHFDYLFFSPGLVVAFIFVASVVIIFSRWKEIPKSYFIFFIVSIITLGFLFILSSIPMIDYPRFAAARYISPLVPFVGLIIAYGVKLSRHEIYNRAILLLAFVYPIWQVPHIYAQYIALDNTALEFSGHVRFAEPLIQQGYSIITTGENFEKNTITGITIGGEIPGAFRNYYGFAGKMLFGNKYVQKDLGSNPVVLPDKWILFTAIPPIDISKTKIAIKEPFLVFKVPLPTERYSTTFERHMSNFATYFGSHLVTFYDNGNIPLLNDSMFYLYVSCATNDCQIESYKMYGQVNEIIKSQRIGSLY